VVEEADELGPCPELLDDEDIDPAGDGGPTFNMPRTMYLASFASTSLERALVLDVVVAAAVVVVFAVGAVSCSTALEILSPRFGSGVDSRALRLVRRRSEDEFSIFLLSLSLVCLYFCTVFASLSVHSKKWLFPLLPHYFTFTEREMRVRFKRERN
jgi:hypothetical protein